MIEPKAEDSTYWEPANNVNELYQQLSANKYRDIESSQIQYVKVQREPLLYSILNN